MFKLSSEFANSKNVNMIQVMMRILDELIVVSNVSVNIKLNKCFVDISFERWYNTEKTIWILCALDICKKVILTDKNTEIKIEFHNDNNNEFHKALKMSYEKCYEMYKSGLEKFNCKNLSSQINILSYDSEDEEQIKIRDFIQEADEWHDSYIEIKEELKKKLTPQNFMEWELNHEKNMSKREKDYVLFLRTGYINL